MSGFPIDQGACGQGAASYEAGLITLPNGATHGVEAITRLTVGKGTVPRAFPGFLGALRDALPAGGGLAMPARLAVSTVRAGLGVIEDGLAPDHAEPVSVEIAFDDGTAIVARMPPDLIAAIRRDREVALAAVARASHKPSAKADVMPETAEALTSIFRYEKRNGRLRRIVEPDPPSET